MTPRSATALVALLAAAAAGCSSASSRPPAHAAPTARSTPPPRATSTTPSAGAPTTTTAPVQYVRPPCHAMRPAPPRAVPVAGGAPSDADITSFDGTRIRVHWFPNPKASAQHRLPTVLKGPGWTQPGDTDTTTRGAGAFGDVNIANLWDAGYNVLTWDPRGFAGSDGVVESDAPDFEGRDAQVLLDWVAAQATALLDGPGDPRVGMVGGSYGGGIQLVLAAIDCRVDAIVPTIAWHSLATSLDPNDTVKQGWGDLLYSFARSRRLDPHITSAHQQGDATGVISAADRAWFASRGPGDALIARITAPTLFVQGTADNLFPLAEAVTSFEQLRRRDVPTAMLWYCGGHGVCLTNGGDFTRPNRAAIAWLDRYVARDSPARTPAVPEFATVDQNGVEHVADRYPPTAGAPVFGRGSGDLALVPSRLTAPRPVRAGDPGGILGTIAGAVTPTAATNALDTDVVVPTSAMVLGAPQLTITYTGAAAPGARPTRVFAQLVEPTTGIVVGNQVTPIPVTLDGARHTTTARLEIVVFAAPAGAHLTLQLLTTTPAYAQPRLGGRVHFGAIELSLPTVVGMRVETR